MGIGSGSELASSRGATIAALRVGGQSACCRSSSAGVLCSLALGLPSLAAVCAGSWSTGRRLTGQSPTVPIRRLLAVAALLQKRTAGAVQSPSGAIGSSPS